MPYVGQCGLVVQDDGDSTPFKVSFAGRPPCYFREEELEIAELEAEQVEFRAAVPFSLSEAGRKLHRHELRLDCRTSNTCDIDGSGCRRRGTAYRCTLGCDFDVCLVCHATAHASATRAIATQEGPGWRLATQVSLNLSLTLTLILVLSLTLTLTLTLNL